MEGLLAAPLVVFNSFSNALLMLGWLVQNAAWDVMTKTGLAAVPFIALIASEWYKARQEGDDEGNKGVLTVNRIETRLYAMALIFLFTCQPILQLQLNTVNWDAERSQQCGTSQFAEGEWGESAQNILDGETAYIPVWWAFVHAVSHGITGAAISAIPCGTDYYAMRTELDLEAIEDPSLQREVGEFQQACFGPARNLLFQETGNVDHLNIAATDWIGGQFFLDTPGYYDSFHAQRPVQGFPYNEQRDMSRPNTGPGQPGYPTCEEWWSASDVGLRARLYDQVSPSLWEKTKSVLSSNNAEDYVIRRMVSPRSGAANGNAAAVAAGYRSLDGGMMSDIGDGVVRTGAAIGGGLGLFPLAAGMDMVKQSLPQVQAILVMAFVISLPFVMVISGYSYKAVGLATFALFGTWFLNFWWELARWLDSRMIELIYGGDSTTLGSWLAAVDNAYDKVVLQFIQAMMFIMLPAVWLGVLSWAGMTVGTAIGQGLQNSSKGAQGAGEKGGSKLQSTATKGKA